MKRKSVFALLLLLAVLVLAVPACGATITVSTPPVRVPFGEPDFPNLGKYWVIDTTKSLDETTLVETDAVLEKARAQGYAQQAIVLMKGVKDPVNYITQLARHLGLGEVAGKNKNNGILWLVLIDEPPDKTLWYTIGTGLPEFTSFEAGVVIDTAHQYADKADWAGTVKTIAVEAEKNLEKVYPNGAPGGLSSTPEATPSSGSSTSGDKSKQLTPEQQKQLVVVIIIVVILWVVIGVVLFAIDPDLGILWFEMTIRILLIAVTAGKSSGSSSRSGSGGSFGGRSGR